MLAVTTHSRTKGLRYTVPMVLAGRRIARDLRDAPECERYANVIAGPREFWTLTIWRDTSAMRTRMRRGTHGRVIWRQPYWLECYWGMRWRPGRHRSGGWEGKAWSWPAARDPEPAPVPDGSAELPFWLRAALGRTVPVDRRQVAGAAGATYRLRVPLWRVPSALRGLRGLRRSVERDPDTFRASVGFGTAGALYLLIVARSPEALDRMRARPEHARLAARWGARLWVATWEPESEFGNWAGHKLREGRLVTAPLLVDVRLPAGPESATKAREILRARLPGVTADRADAVELLTSELVANTFRHAGLTAADRVGLRIRGAGDRIRVEVSDRGRRFEPIVPAAKSTEDPSGWGLYLLDRMSDRWGIIDEPQERRIWFELRG